MTAPALPTRESLTVEFKSDRHKLPDRELVEALVCLANAEGGELWLGVEDDGTPTGLHAEHRLLDGLAGLVAASTSPALAVVVTPVTINGVALAQIRVSKAAGEVATTRGVYLRRRIRHDGKPECVAMLPHERASHASRFGLLDVSAQPVAGARLEDFDPLERERLRQSVQQYGGDRVLLELDDAAMDGALGLTARQSDGSRVPTLTGLLLLGRDEDPVLYRKLSERLEQMLHSLGEQWEQLALALKGVIDEIRAGQVRVDGDAAGAADVPEHCAPFLRLLTDAAAGVATPSSRERQRLAELAVELVETIVAELTPNFWRPANQPARDALGTRLFEAMMKARLLPAAQLEALTDKLLELARANHARLVQA